MATPIPSNAAAFSLNELLLATGAELLVPGSASCVGVSTDSRTELKGAAFVALVGERFDAHDFLDKLLETGVAAVVVQECQQSRAFAAQLLTLAETQRPSLLLVEDSLRALGDLALFHRNRFEGRVVSVGGSAGKTTTRSVLSALLEVIAPGKVHSTRGNLNNRIGAPMTLLGLQSHHQFAVVELGTNCPGEIAELTRITRPDVAVLTLIDLEHTEGLGDLDGVEQEEAELFGKLSDEGTAIGFGEDLRVARCVAASRAGTKLSYGFDEGRELQIVSRRLLAPGKSELVLKRADGSTLKFVSTLIGKAGALAVAAGVAACESLSGQQLQSRQCEGALSKVGEPGRHSLVALSQNRWLVDDTYNSNPASVVNSVSTGKELSAQTGGRFWLVLGEMLELGELSRASHEEMGRLAGQSGAAGAFFIQGHAAWAAEIAKKSLNICEFFQNSSEVAELVASHLAPGDVVVIKASRGVRAEAVVEGLARSLGPDHSSQRSSSEQLSLESPCATQSSHDS